MKVIQVGKTLLNVNNISNISIVPHPSGTNGYVVRIIMNNNNCYYEKATDGTNTNLIDFFKNKIVTIGEDNEV